MVKRHGLIGSEPAFRLRSVSFSYNNRGPLALDGVSLDVRIGERVAVLGHNGSGKSTLAKILGALHTPLQGACFIFGHDARGYSPSELRRTVGYVAQNASVQIFGATVEADAAFVPENLGLNSVEIRERVDAALDAVGLFEMLSKKTAESGGYDTSLLSASERQMLAVAGTLAAGVSCLILDEPFAMLDSGGISAMRGLLRSLHASGMTVIEVTHRLDDLCDSDSVIVMENGRIINRYTPEEFFRNAEGLGFELPPMRRILSRMASLGIVSESNSIPDISHAVASFASQSLQSALTEGLPIILNNKYENTASLGGFSADLNTVPQRGRSFIEVRELSFLQDASRSCRRTLGGSPADEAVKILDRVNASFRRGARTSITGRSGSGKTSLLLHINGLQRIQSGRILIDGTDIPKPSRFNFMKGIGRRKNEAGMSLLELRRRVGLIMQFPEEQLFMPTVREELSFAPKNFGLSGRELDDAVMFGMECAGLSEEFLERSPLSLSGGERRLAASASVFAARPECVMIDAPFAGLDAVYRRRLDETLARLCRGGMTVITASDDTESAFVHADSVLFMHCGTVAAEGRASDVLSSLVNSGRLHCIPDVVDLSYNVNKILPHIPLTADCDEFMERCGLA